jgi:AcrR family transcriptional regulator
MAADTPPPPTPGVSNGSARPGRPRSGDADRAILDAAVAVLGEQGFTGLTTSAVIERSGVARATVYRRYPTRESLLLAAASAIKGREPYPLTGDIAHDLQTGARSAASIFASPRFQQFLPAIVAEATKSPAVARAVIARIAPNHANVTAEYADRARQAGMRTDIDPELVPTMLIGTILYRFMSTGLPADDAFADQVVDVLIRGLQAEPAPD